MKKKALATRMAAFVMAGAMTLGMGTTAFAADVTIPFTKTVVDVNTEGNQYIQVPQTNFKFNLAVGGAGNMTVKNTENKDVPVIVNGGIAELLEATFTYDSSLTASNEKVLNGSISVNFDTFYNTDGSLKTGINPGIYHYTLNEIDPADEANKDSNYTSYDGMNYSKEVYDIYLFLYNDKSDNKVLVKKGETIYGQGEGKAGNINFDNTYTTYNLEVEKVVTGNQGDRNKGFTFTIGVSGAENEKYSYSILDADGKPSETPEVLVSGNAATVTLKDGQKVRFYGLSANDKFTVEENSECANDGYTTKYSLNGTEVKGENGGSIYKVSKIVDGKEEGITTDTHDNVVVFTNNKDIITPTGIVTEYAPYILLVAAAGAFAVLFLRRKKEEF